MAIHVINPGAAGPAGAAGSATSNSTFFLTGVITPPAITADETAYAPSGGNTATVWNISSDAEGRSISGILSANTTGRHIRLRNVGLFNIRLAKDGPATTSSRFRFPYDIILRPRTSVDVQYYTDGSIARWYLVASSFQEGFLAAESALAAASTTDLGSVRTTRVALSADAFPTVNTFGTSPNKYRIIRFTGALTLVHSANLSLIGGVNRVIEPGSVGAYASNDSGAWQEVAFTSSTTLSRLAALEADITDLQADIEALGMPERAPDTIDADGAASVTRTTLGREIARTLGNGETYDIGTDEAAGLYFDDADGGRLKAIGGDYTEATTILQPALANTLKRNSAMQRVWGGWRAPFTLRNTNMMGRIGDGTITPDNGRTLYCFICTGQSNARGGEAADEDLLRTTHAFPDRLLMPQTAYEDDVRMRIDEDANQEITDDWVTGLVPLRGAKGLLYNFTHRWGTCQSEIAMATLARKVAEAHDGWTPDLCVFTVYNGNSTVASLGPGGASKVYENVEHAMRGVVNAATKRGYKVNFIGCHIDQGEADLGDVDLANKWVTLVGQWNVTAKSLTGQANDIVPLINQTSSSGSTSQATSERSKVTRYKLDKAIIPVAARYVIGASEWRDVYIHMSQLGHFRLGEHVGCAMFDQFCRGEFIPMYCISATTVSGSGVVTMTLPEAATIDTVEVEANTQNGITVKTTNAGTLIPLTMAPAGNTLVLNLTTPLVQGTHPQPYLFMATQGQNIPRDAAGINRTNIRSVSTYGYSQWGDGRKIAKWMLMDSMQIEYVT